MSNHDASRANLLITADAHVGETEALHERLPEHLRKFLTKQVLADNGDLDFEFAGEIGNFPVRKKLSDRDREKEFRTDLSLGTNLDTRLRDMAREGVDAQVIFPNVGLESAGGLYPVEYYEAYARAYNDYVAEVFSDQPKRFKPAGALPVDNIESAVAEATRCIERGFATLFLPCVVPWQPYRLDVYEPLWSLVEEARIPISFHVFSGNLSLGGEFCDPSQLNEERAAIARKYHEARLGIGEELETVVGMAAGMGPILELTGSGSGALERHPDLQFVITESECGWLAWMLQAMDQMQERRHLYRANLPLRASEYFLRQGHVTITDDAVALHNIQFTGGADRLLWGNDYPHDEGTWPESGPFIDTIRKTLSPDDAQKLLCGNAARLYGFDLDYLTSHKSELVAA
jgi:predicted TIM-barrel fold metal-dependent hydrolase